MYNSSVPVCAVEAGRNDLWQHNISSKKWTWLSGDTTSATYPVYGVQGEPSVNYKPGSRQLHSMALDTVHQRIYIFAGVGFAKTNLGGSAYLLNDLWVYNLSSMEWTWLKGSDSIGANSFYGTKGVPDSRNQPFVRYGHSMIVDSKNQVFYVFGGMHIARGKCAVESKCQDDSSCVSGFFNDLWSFDMINNIWTWISGENPEPTINPVGYYGDRGVKHPANIIGSRWQYGIAIDSDRQEIYIFGGEGVAKNSSQGSSQI